MMSRHFQGALLISFILFMIALTSCPLIGPVPLDWKDVFGAKQADSISPDTVIFFTIRLPRVLLALLAGAALSCSGAVFQTILRNPLVCPYTLGVAGGASLGAVTALILPFPLVILGIPSTIFLAFTGAILSLFLVLGISSAVRPFNTTTLVLAGIAANFIFNALILLFYFASDFTQSAAMFHWLLGGLDTADSAAVIILGLSLFPLLFLLARLTRELDILAAGEEFARTKGVSVERTTLVSLLVASLLTGAVVAHTGPIGFLGLLVPHILRPFTGSHHRILLPASAFLGGAFLAACDSTARVLFSPAELPVGVITAAIGGPFFLFLLFRIKRPFTTN